VLGLLLAVALPAVAAEAIPPAREITVCSDPWPPYAGDARDLRPGYVVDILRAALEPRGFRVKYVNAPWSRCIHEVRVGHYAGIVGADRNEVPDFLFHEEPVGFTHPTFFTLPRSGWTWAGLASIETLRIGVTQSYTYSPEIDGYIAKRAGTPSVVAVPGVDSIPRLLSMLEAGRIDAFLDNPVVVQETLRRRGISTDRLREAGGPTGDWVYVPLSPVRPESPQVAAAVDDGIRRLRASGRLAEILASYRIADWPAKPRTR
jgi:polar amino acid transport system substrate-binding protein